MPKGIFFCLIAQEILYALLDSAHCFRRIKAGGRKKSTKVSIQRIDFFCLIAQEILYPPLFYFALLNKTKQGGCKNMPKGIFFCLTAQEIISTEILRLLASGSSKIALRMTILLDGKAEISISGKLCNVKMGQIIIMPANKPHALKAIERFKMMLVMIKA